MWGAPRRRGGRPAPSASRASRSRSSAGRRGACRRASRCAMICFGRLLVGAARVGEVGHLPCGWPRLRRGSSRRPPPPAGSRGPPRSCRSPRPARGAWRRPARGSRRRSSSVLVSSPGAPTMWPRSFVGEGMPGWSGTYDTHGDRKRGSVVAAAIASLEPGSGVSGACARAADVAAESAMGRARASGETREGSIGSSSRSSRGTLSSARPRCQTGSSRLEDRRAQALAVGVERQRARDAAAERPLQHEVERADPRQRVAHHVARDDAAEDAPSRARR